MINFPVLITDLRRFLDMGVSSGRAGLSVTGVSYGADGAGAQATAQSERIKA